MNDPLFTIFLNKRDDGLLEPLGCIEEFKHFSGGSVAITEDQFDKTHRIALIHRFRLIKPNAQDQP